MMEVKWTLCQSNDITKFQMDLVGHTRAIQDLERHLVNSLGNPQGKPAYSAKKVR